MITFSPGEQRAKTFQAERIACTKDVEEHGVSAGEEATQLGRHRGLGEHSGVQSKADH